LIYVNIGIYGGFVNQDSGDLQKWAHRFSLTFWHKESTSPHDLRLVDACIWDSLPLVALEDCLISSKR
jgi:hypothetical protein